MTGNDLIDDALIEIEADGVREHRTLPGVLVRMVTSTRASFPRVRAYQAHGWHVFLVSLARIALDHAGWTVPPRTEADWTRLLRALTPDAPTAWRLVVEDHTAPAFLQPPVPDGNVDKFKPQHTPDQLDLTFSARGHSIKDRQDLDARPEDWLHAVVASQTLSFYTNNGQRRSCRTADGCGSRVVVTLGARDCPAHLFRRDLEALGDLAAPAPYHPGGPGLLWLEPWGGTVEEMKPLTGLHPTFIEPCRRIRLVSRGGRIRALRGEARASRMIAAARDKSCDLMGNIADPWTPIDRDNQRALRLFETGFDARVTLRLLLDKDSYLPAPLQTARPGELDAPRLLVIARSTTARKGWSGFTERVIEVPRRARFVLGGGPRREEHGEIIRQALEEADTLRSTGLMPSIATLTQPTKHAVNWDLFYEEDAHVRMLTSALARFDQALEVNLLNLVHLLVNEPESRGPAHYRLRRSLIEAAFMSLDQAAALNNTFGLKGHEAYAIAKGRLTDRLYRTLARGTLQAA